MGPAGSSGKNGCSLVSGMGAAAAADAYRLRSAMGATLTALGALELMSAGRKRPAVRRSEAIMTVVWKKEDVGYQRQFAIAARSFEMRGSVARAHPSYCLITLLKRGSNSERTLFKCGNTDLQIPPHFARNTPLLIAIPLFDVGRWKPTLYPEIGCTRELQGSRELIWADSLNHLLRGLDAGDAQGLVAIPCSNLRAHTYLGMPSLISRRRDLQFRAACMHDCLLFDH
jgi:hypothetical protein